MDVESGMGERERRSGTVEVVVRVESQSRKRRILEPGIALVPLSNGGTV